MKLENELSMRHWTRIIRLTLFGLVLLGSVQGKIGFAQSHVSNKTTGSESGMRQKSNVETIDDLCDLIAGRLKYIEQVSRSKWNSRSPIEDLAREQVILDEVNLKAAKLGLSPMWAQHFFRLQIEASKQIEYQLFAEWQQKQQGQFPDTLDLKSQIRPQLDEMTDSLLSALRANWNLLSSRDAAQRVKACRVNSVYPQTLKVALSPLLDRSAETADSIDSASK